MMTFVYHARTLEGERVDGSMRATDRASVVDHLRGRALFVTHVAASRTDATTVRGWLDSYGQAGSLPTMYRSLATLIASGVPLARALEVTIASIRSRSLAERLRGVLADVRDGTSLGTAMRTRAFPLLHVAMIDAAEEGGVQCEIIDRLATLLENEETLRKKIGAALVYPTIVLAAAIALTLLLLATIVPTFAAMFAQLGIPLPPSTRMLLALGTWLGHPVAWLAFALAPGGAFALAVLARRPPAAALLDDARLRLPAYGRLMRRRIEGRTARMLGTLLWSGVDVLRAIDTVAPIAGNRTYERALRNVGRSLREGAAWSTPLEAAGIFDPMLIAMVRVGEESGRLDSMLIHAATHFERDAEHGTLALSAAIEPALIAVVGSIVGTIVFSLFVPLYSLVGQIR